MSAVAARPRVSIGAIPIDPLGFDEAIDAVLALVARGEGGTVMTPNVDHVVLAERDRELREAYADASLSLVDGMMLLRAARVLGRPLPEKVSGSDLFVPLVARASERRLRIQLCGGNPGVAEACARKLVGELPSLVVAGTFAPKVDLARDPKTHDEIVARIRDLRPDLVFLAFGCPKQEVLMHRIARAVTPAVLVGIGASLDFVAGTIPRAPRWMSDAGLEWLHRLAREPRRLAPRYLVRDPRFLAILARELLRQHAHAEAA